MSDKDRAVKAALRWQDRAEAAEADRDRLAAANAALEAKLARGWWGALERMTSGTRAEIARKDQAIEAWREDLTNERADRDRMAAANAALEAKLARLVGALEALRHAVCGEAGFASCVRADSGKAYPWPALDEAEALVNAALAEVQARDEGAKG